jgi:hypothetical protein
MANKIEANCDICKKPFKAKASERNRGWARCCSLSCAAKHRAKKRKEDLTEKKEGLSK